jgi:hypothetical protein
MKCKNQPILHYELAIINLLFLCKWEYSDGAFSFADWFSFLYLARANRFVRQSEHLNLFSPLVWNEAQPHIFSPRTFKLILEEIEV